MIHEVMMSKKLTNDVRRMTRPANVAGKLFDVIIAGGGLCGIGAALALKNNPTLKKGERGGFNKILILERRLSPGWEVCSALSTDLGADNTFVTSVLKERLTSMGGLKNNRVDPPMFEFLLNALLEEKNIDILLCAHPMQVTVKGDLVTAIIAGTKSGEMSFGAKIFIDATEEALLWKQTGVPFTDNDPPPAARQAVFFNNIEQEITSPVLPGDFAEAKNIVIRPSVWQKEACAEFDIPSGSISSCRLATFSIISFTREKVPQLKDAIVTHTGFEPLPMDAVSCPNTGAESHPYFRNLFAAGLWAVPDTRKRQRSATLAGRIQIGEKAGMLTSNVRIKPVKPSGAELLSKPATAEADVVVAGGGTAGAIAAIAAARQNANVILIETSTVLGGIGTGGGIHGYCVGAPGGLQDEVDAAVEKVSPVFSGKHSAQGFHPEAKKFALEQMARDAGVQIIYSSLVVGVCEKKGRRIKRVIAATPSGRTVFSAKAFVDCTGDADIAVMAGAPFTIGRESDEVPHCYSQSGGHLDKNGNMEMINFDAGWADPFDAFDLTASRRKGLKCLEQRFPAQNRLLYIAPILGVRQSRQIAGDYRLTLADEILARRFEDCVGFMKTFYENHANDIENQSDEGVLWMWVLGNFFKPIGCEIPYRCMLPKNVEGLLVACRAVSVTMDAHYGFRMMRDLQRIGEAAGIAAAISARLGKTPRQLDVKLVQEQLKKTGALDEKFRPVPLIPENFRNDTSRLAETGEPKDIIYPLAISGKSAVPALLKILETAKPENKFLPAVALAMLKRKEAVRELVKNVVERNPARVQENGAAPRWKSAIVMLGRAGSPEALPALLGVLEDKNADADALIAALRAMGRIKNRKAVPMILKFLKRKDIPQIRKFQVSCAGVAPVEEDVLWQIELAAAEALAALGKPQPSIIRKYLDHPRSYVRRYAAKIKGT